METLHGVHPVREALRAARRPLLRLWLQAGPRHAELAALRAEAERRGVPVSELDAAEFAARAAAAGAADANPQRVMLEAGPLPQLSLDELLADRAAPRCVVVLDGVEDPQNVGALARVAEASGANGLVLARRRAPPLGPAVVRASAGAIEWLPVARVANLARAIDALRDRGFWTVGADAAAPTSLFEAPDRILRGDLAVVLGAEGRGMRAAVASRIDHPLSIPMRGHVDSLNVSAAGAVVLYELLRRRSRATG